jgi:DNA-binding GntR family transcriptional regulator
MVDDRHIHGAEHAIGHRAWAGNLQEMASLVLSHGSLISSDLSSIGHIAFNLSDINQIIVCNFLIDGLPGKAYVPPMKPLIPNDATSTALAADAISDREDQSLHDEILTRLRDHIVEGNIPDGGRIPERQLCEMLGISRTPLREALKVLASEGLVELLPNRGARVRQLSECDLDELFDVMGGLEGLAGRLACENITDAEIAEIERLHYEMYGFYLHRDMHGYFRVNQLIHRKIVEASRNATLLGAYANFAGRIRRVRYSANFTRKRDRWGEAMREHEAILDALRRRAGSELSDILFAHLRNKRTAAVEHLKEDASATPEPA